MTLPALRRLPAGLEPRRAWAHPDGLAVEARDCTGAVVALVVADTQIRLLAGRDGALPGLAPALARPGTVLLGHRPGRRAVLREADGHYVKVVRPGRAGRVARGLHGAGRLLAAAAAVPAVCATDDKVGWVRLDPLPGPALHHLLRSDGLAAAALAAGVATALAALRAADTGDTAGLPRHTATDEAAVVRRWVDDADGWAGGDLAAHLDPVLGRLGTLRDPRWVPCHRDLHDKQVLATSHGAVGLLDFDTLCTADPALDVGNLLAHLCLRTLQGHARPVLAARCANALLDASGALDGPALRAYTGAALLRLAAVYTFRPGPPDLPARLATAAVDPGLALWSTL